MHTRNLPFLLIESAVIRTKVLSANEKWVYTVIKSFRNRKSKLCFPSIKKIEKRSELSKPTVLRCRKRIRELGLITWEDQKDWKKSNHYRFPLEEGSEEEILRILENLQMVKKGTIVDGQKENQHMVRRETIHGLVEKIGSMSDLTKDSRDTQMVKKGTPNHINQMNITNRTGSADRPLPKSGDRSASPNDPKEKTPMGYDEWKEQPRTVGKDQRVCRNCGRRVNRIINGLCDACSGNSFK